MTENGSTGAGALELGGDLPVNRLGFGAMRLCGPGVWGEPEDPRAAGAALRRTVELGIDLIDTADAYGPGVNERQISQALHPYPENLVIATKGGYTRQRPGPLADQRTPETPARGLRGQPQAPQAGPDRPLPAPPPGQARRLRGHDLDSGRAARGGQDPARRSLERRRAGARNGAGHLGHRLRPEPLQPHRPLLAGCDWGLRARGVAFFPWFPLATGKLARPGGALDGISSRHGATPAQVALAWLLAKSPVMLPIPGTSSVEPLEENVAAAGLRLTDAEIAALS